MEEKPMSKRILLLVLSFALVAALALTGCAPARRPYNNDNNLGQNGTPATEYRGNTGGGVTGAGNNGGMNNWANYPNTGDNVGFTNNRDDDDDTVRAERISTAVEQIQGVENSTVVVTGNTAYVGIDLEQSPRTANERDIKREVAQMIKSQGGDINTVYVSTEVDFMDRLRNVGEGLRNGRPVDAFTTELNEMVRRITPDRW
jgi:YhcN/YlaJ family sporulation lipoprotein